MGLLARLRSLFGSPVAPTADSGNSQHLSDATDALNELRGDRIHIQPPDHGASEIDNVTAATKDYGLSRFTGETDAIEGAAKSYRPAKSRRERSQDR